MLSMFTSWFIPGYIPDSMANSVTVPIRQYITITFGQSITITISWQF